MTRPLSARTLASVLRLGPVRWLDAFRVVLVAVTIELALRWSTLPRICALLGVSFDPEQPPSDPPGSSVPPPLTRREVERVDIVRRVLSHRPFNGTCLRQSLQVGHVLSRRRPRLVLGVAKVENELRAHAWLVVEGVVVDGYRAVLDAEPGFEVGWAGIPDVSERRRSR